MTKKPISAEQAAQLNSDLAATFRRAVDNMSYTKAIDLLDTASDLDGEIFPCQMQLNVVQKFLEKQGDVKTS